MHNRSFSPGNAVKATNYVLVSVIASFISIAVLVSLPPESDATPIISFAIFGGSMFVLGWVLRGGREAARRFYGR